MTREGMMNKRTQQIVIHMPLAFVEIVQGNKINYFLPKDELKDFSESCASKLLNDQAYRIFIDKETTISFSAKANVIDSQGAYLVVSINTTVYWEGEIETELVNISIDVSEIGWLTIAFLNEAYQPPKDRKLLISNFSFSQN